MASAMMAALFAAIAGVAGVVWNGAAIAADPKGSIGGVGVGLVKAPISNGNIGVALIKLPK